MSDTGFSLYTRRLADGKLRYYAKFKLPNGSWSGGVPTGKTNEDAARRWANERIESGEVPNPRGRVPTLDGWATGFFGVGGRYDRAKRARGRQLSAAYLNGLGQRYRKYIAPVFGNRKLDDITTMDLDSFFLDLYDTDLSGSSVNGVLRSVRALFSEAERLGVIPRSPAARVPRFADNNRTRGVLTQKELDKLFAVDALETVWDGQRVPYLICMIAAGCGLRQGEIIALRPQDFRDGMVIVDRQYDKAGHAYKRPKWNSSRTVPAGERIRSEVEAFVGGEKIEESALLFPSRSADRPIEAHIVLNALRDALGEIGIGREEQTRDKRFIDLHSLRHTYVTRLRTSGVADWELQAAAGHRSEIITNNYTHAEGRDLSGVKAANILPFAKPA